MGTRTWGGERKEGMDGKRGGEIDGREGKGRGYREKTLTGRDKKNSRRGKTERNWAGREMDGYVGRKGQKKNRGKCMEVK